MDVDYTLVQKPSHDLGVELDLVRNDARYGPKLATTLQHRNPTGMGCRKCVGGRLRLCGCRPVLHA